MPTAWNGRVLVGTRSGHLLAFGSSTAHAVKAAPVDFGSVPVGSSRTVTVEATASQATTLDGPADVSGYQATTNPDQPSGSTTATTTPAGATAGPASIPASGTEAVPGGVFTVSQPTAGTRVSAGGRIPLRVTFTPTGPGPVIADLSLPTSTGAESIPLSGYGTSPGLLQSAQPLAFGTVRTGAGGLTLTASVSNSWDRPETITGVDLGGGPYTLVGGAARPAGCWRRTRRSRFR